MPLSFCLQSFPPSGSFPMNQLFISGGQSTGASASAFHLQGGAPKLGEKYTTLNKDLWRAFMMRVSESSFELKNTTDFLCFSWGLELTRTIGLLSKHQGCTKSSRNYPRTMSASVHGKGGWNSPGWKHKVTQLFATLRTLLSCCSFPTTPTV